MLQEQIPLLPGKCPFFWPLVSSCSEARLDARLTAYLRPLLTEGATLTRGIHGWAQAETRPPTTDNGAGTRSFTLDPPNAHGEGQALHTAALQILQGPPTGPTPTRLLSLAKRRHVGLQPQPVLSGQTFGHQPPAVGGQLRAVGSQSLAARPATGALQRCSVWLNNFFTGI